MSVLKSLGKDTFNYGIGKIMPQVIGFFLIPVYTRFLNPSDYGIVEMTGVFSAFVMIFMRMALPGSITRFYYDYKESTNLRDYITSVFWLMKLLGLIVGIVAGIITYYFAEKFIPGMPFWPFAVIALITSFLTTNSEIQKRLLQARRQSAYSAKLNIITAAIGISLVLFFVAYLRMGALGFVLAGLCSAILFFVQANFYLRHDIKGKFKPELLKHSVKYAIHILPSHLITPFCALFSRSLLSLDYSLESVGVFSIANRFMSPVLIIGTAFTSSYIPVYFETRESNNQEGLDKLMTASNRIWLLANLVFVCMSILGPLLIVLLTPIKYHSGSSLIPILSFSYLSGMFSDLYCQEIYYSKKTYWVSLIAAMRFVVNISIVLLTMNSLGIYSIPLSLLAESLMITIISYIVSQNIFHIKKDYKFIITNLMLSLTTSVIFFILLLGKQPFVYLVLAGCGLLMTYLIILFYRYNFNPKQILQYIQRKKTK